MRPCEKHNYKFYDKYGHEVLDVAKAKKRQCSVCGILHIKEETWTRYVPLVEKAKEENAIE